MIIIEPVAVTDDMVVATNIIEEAPRASAGVSYSKWSSGTAFSAGNTVCHEFTPQFSSDMYGRGDLFAVFTSVIGSNINYEPEKKWWFGSGTLPGWGFWTRGAYAPRWNAATTYNKGAVVGRISGSTGAFYTSLTNDNVGNDPASSPTNWRQTTTDSYESYAGGTPYGSGSRVARISGTLCNVFESRVGSNSGNTPESSPTQWEFKGQAYKLWASGTAYSTGDIVTDTRTHHNYEALQSSTGKDPTSSANTAWWLDLGANNRWAMFDLSATSQSSYGDAIDVTVALPGLCDSVAIMNMTAQQVQVIATRNGVEHYNETFDLSNPGLITDWRRFFFDPVTYSADLIVTDLPLLTNLQVRVIVSHPGDVAKVGVCAFGKANEIGATIYGAETGILDSSRKERNDFGEYTLVERAYSKRASFRVVVDATDPANVDRVQNTLARIRATPVIYRGTGDYASTWVMGFFRDFGITIEQPQQSFLNIEIEGLT
jgi:hypothetical protein